MKKAEQLRVETDKLEQKIKLAVDEFIKEVGRCSIDISTEVILYENSFEKQHVSTNVKVSVTV